MANQEKISTKFPVTQQNKLPQSLFQQFCWKIKMAANLCEEKEDEKSWKRKCRKSILRHCTEKIISIGSNVTKLWKFKKFCLLSRQKIRLVQSILRHCIGRKYAIAQWAEEWKIIANDMYAQWPKMRKKVHFGRTMHCLSQRLKWTFFWNFFFTPGLLQGPFTRKKKC